MPERESKLASKNRESILQEHLNLGKVKPVSYLPLSTVKDVIGMPVSTYIRMAEDSGNQYAIFGDRECCIHSGAIYLYKSKELSDILEEHSGVLSMHGWPTNPSEFICKLAADWLSLDHPVIPVIRRAFGDQA